MSNGGIFGFTWLEDPVIHGLGCGSHSCKYVKPTGMGTNGRCHCSQNHGDKVERFLLRNLAKQHQINQQLQADLAVEKLLETSTDVT